MAITTTSVTDNQIVADGRPSGTLIGASSTELIGFFGATPVAQQTNSTTMTASSATTTSIATEVNKITTVLANLGLAA